MTTLLRLSKPTLTRTFLQQCTSVSASSPILLPLFGCRYNSHFRFSCTYTTKAIVVPNETNRHKDLASQFLLEGEGTPSTSTDATKDNLLNTHGPSQSPPSQIMPTSTPTNSVDSATTSTSTSISTSTPTGTVTTTTISKSTPISTPKPPTSICTPPPTADHLTTHIQPAERVKDLKGLIDAYLSLSKFRLSALIVVTTMAGYVLAPVPFNLPTFIASTVGTSLACASANIFNQIYEVAYDAKMVRTKRRILPSGKISIAHASLVGAVTGVTGPLILLYGVNAFAASLAFANIVLYAGVYTPLKRVHPINTWVGSIVGAVPPVIGWVSATNSMDLGAWVLGGLLFVWQIPHFLALSWGYKNDYANAGYKMLSNVYPEKLPKFCLRYCIYLLPVGVLSWWSGMTTMTFVFDSLIIDAYLLWFGYQFYRESTPLKARKLFFATLIFLPVFLGLMMVHSTKLRGQKQIEQSGNKP